MTLALPPSTLPIPSTPDALALFHGEPAAPPRTLLDVLAATAWRFPAAPALDDGGTVLDYRALLAEVRGRAAALTALGIGAGDRVGVRAPSGTVDLHLCVLAVLTAGAAYVPVDADDPDERAALVWSEAGVCAVLTGGEQPRLLAEPGRDLREPGLADDAWIIFTSGSTGRPKGVAVSHRSAAAFVDAEARLFCQDEPIGPGDRVLAGLSVAFDASCEEMWLAWRHGACLVPAPRALVRTGLDLGPWLVEREITVVSTVPTLAALWPIAALDDVRLLIFGGEACPPELGERLAVEGREVWNTYGPTEATVVACAAQLTADGPVRIGLPLAGWDLAVLDRAGQPVAMGETGELVIGGAGLARYLDPVKDAEKFAPLPSLDWDRAYRSGDLVRAEAAGLVFCGRADEQVKLGGRRIELGEVDAALQALPLVAGAAAAVRTTTAGHQVLVGYLVPQPGFDAGSARERLLAGLPAALVPLLAEVDTLPTRTSGKVDRAALPWPLAVARPGEAGDGLTGSAARLAEHWTELLGSPVTSVDADFFALGGGSLAAAQLVSRLRERHPEVSVSDVYRASRLGGLAARLDELGAGTGTAREVALVPRLTGFVQTAVTVGTATIVGLRWVVALAAINLLLGWPSVPWWGVLAGYVAFVSPIGRLGIAAAGARLLLRGLKPGSYPRGGAVHLRLWAAERLADACGVGNLSGAPWIAYYARALGAKVGPDVDLHSLPPVTGMLKLGKGAAVEPEVDLAGHWLDGDVLHIGRIRIGADARVGARSTLFPGARVGKRAEIAPGSGVRGSVRAGQRWAGTPAAATGKPSTQAARLARSTAAIKLNKPGKPARAQRSRRWVLAYGVTSFLLGLVPLAGALPGLLVLAHTDLTLTGVLAAVPLATVLTLVGYAVLFVVCVRLLGIGMTAGEFPVHSRAGWQVWSTERLMDLARVLLFPLYASLFTPVWLRLLGARVGRRTEISTVLAVPRMTTVADGAFLADDTMVASYELGGGRLRVGAARVGERGFLGNSGMTAAGRSVPDGGLVAVLSATPKKAKAGSSWLGMPPMKLRRTSGDADPGRTFDPPKRLILARALVELCRVVPVMCTVALAVLVLAGLEVLAAHGFWLAVLGCGVLLAGAGAVAAAVTTLAKWLLVGRFRPVEHPLWSAFVWRNELADTFTETLAAPWFAGLVTGTPLLSVWLRGMGARIGRGVWCDTYWLPESDLISLGDGATVNRGCVVQTHLFHDRVMVMAPVTLGAGATLGPHGIVLPGATLGDGATVGPASLVMRGESVPAGTRWLGNPIATWTAQPGDGKVAG